MIDRTQHHKYMLHCVLFQPICWCIASYSVDCTWRINISRSLWRLTAINMDIISTV